MRAIIGLENPSTPHNPQLPPLVEAAQWARKHFVHIHYFEPPGPADAALNAQPREFLSGVFYALSGDYHYLDVWKHPPGTSYLDALPQPPPLPWSWLSELEMEFFVSEYARTGFTGGLNWYRAMDLRWAQRRQFEGMKNPAPFFFIGSERDCDLEAWHGDDPLGQLRLQYEDVRGVAMLAEAGHMMQMERPAEVNEWIVNSSANCADGDGNLIAPLSLYVHFPWCVRKCPYCDFNSYTLNGELRRGLTSSGSAAILPRRRPRSAAAPCGRCSWAAARRACFRRARSSGCWRWRTSTWVWRRMSR